MRFFTPKEEKGSRASSSERIPRHSSSWAQLLKTLQQRQELRILDFGATSPSNINFVTGMGHSIYMADLVGAAKDPSWFQQSELFSEAVFDVRRFIAENLDFGDRQFDIVLLWDTVDYLNPALADAVIDKLHGVMVEGALLLSFFHVKPDDEFYRYHLREDEQVDMQYAGKVEMTRALTNRQIESLFSNFSGYKFFLAKDNLREVLVTR